MKKGYVLVKFYFEGSRGTESGVYFDISGKISRIALIEQVIEREIAQSKSIPQPITVITYHIFDICLHLFSVCHQRRNKTIIFISIILIPSNLECFCVFG